MPKIVAPKESLEGKSFTSLPGGVYTFRVDGFKPTFSKDKQSYNLRPQLKVINHPTANDQPIWEYLNSGAGWVQRDFCHSLAIPLEGPDETGGLPGDFDGTPDNPEAWKYRGPIVGRTGQCELAQVMGKDKNGNPKMQTVVKRYICAVPGCQVQHKDLN